MGRSEVAIERCVGGLAVMIRKHLWGYTTMMLTGGQEPALAGRRNVFAIAIPHSSFGHTKYNAKPY
jgi:hypothetical protein